MHSLSFAQIIAIWEQGREQHPIDRALTMLTPAVSEMTRDQLADLPVGIRNAHLLTIHGQTFGNSLDGLATCPQCSENLEFSLPVADIQGKSSSDTDNSNMLDVASHRVEFRLPTSKDLAAMVGYESVSAGRQLLMDRCVLSATSDGSSVSTVTLPEQVIRELSEKILACDPQADMVLDLDCPSCALAWQSSLDIVYFLWEEISARARSLLFEIHTLASAYGWSEQAILSLSPIRRHYYLEMVL